MLRALTSPGPRGKTWGGIETQGDFMKKVYASAAEALDGLLSDGMLIAAGGFGLCGIPSF